jgi:hypothetical protein
MYVVRLRLADAAHRRWMFLARSAVQSATDGIPRSLAYAERHRTLVTKRGNFARGALAFA